MQLPLPFHFHQKSTLIVLLLAFFFLMPRRTCLTYPNTRQMCRMAISQPWTRFDCTEAVGKLMRKSVITSDSNNKIKVARSILSAQKSKQGQDTVVVEGYRLIIDAIKYGLSPKWVLFSEHTPLQSPLMENLLQALHLQETVQIDRITNSIFNSISDTVTSQGVIAAFQKPPTLSTLPVPKNKNALVLVLDRPSDPGNVGTLIRTAYAFDVDAVVVAEGCDVWSPKVIRCEAPLLMLFVTLLHFPMRFIM